MLNFIDGLCGDDSIFVFTTCHKDQLDPAWLNPGHMDMHIRLTYWTIKGFKLLVSNYLDIHHPLFWREWSENVKVSPVEVVEELMKSDDANALGGLVKLLRAFLL